MSCSTGCATQDHATFGECLRAKNMHTAYMAEWKGSDATLQKKADKNLDLYERARSQGIQPKSTSARDVNRAVRISDHTGEAFRA